MSRIKKKSLWCNELGRYISCCNQSIRGCVAPLPSVPARHVFETLFDLRSVIVTRSRWQADTMSHLAALPVHGTKEYGVMGVYIGPHATRHCMMRDVVIWALTKRTLPHRIIVRPSFNSCHDVRHKRVKEYNPSVLY